jgi:lipoic acid synthetase
MLRLARLEIMTQFPGWIVDEARRNKAGLRDKSSQNTMGDLSAARLRTVCDEALCPNKGKCFSQGEATFLILGDSCTRGCGFCAVSKTIPSPPDPDEPRRVAELSKRWKLRHVVFTSPTRDDLPDGGAAHFAETVRELRKADPAIETEPLIPDLKGDLRALSVILASGPSVLGHNVETVPSLYGSARAGSDYNRSLKLISAAKHMRPEILTKSGLMLGLGESEKELERVLLDLLACGCDVLTLGQYLAPSKKHMPVERYLTPEEFSAWEEKACKLGFKAALCGPLVRSSYHAGALYRKAKGWTK